MIKSSCIQDYTAIGVKYSQWLQFLAFLHSVKVSFL